MHTSPNGGGDSGGAESVRREMWTMFRFCLLIVVAYTGLMLAFGKTPPTNNKPWRPVTLRTNVTHLPPLPGQTNAMLVTNVATVARLTGVSPGPPPTARTNLLVGWTTSPTTPGMTTSNQVQSSTDLKTWQPFFWVKADGSAVVVSIAIDPKKPMKFFRLGTNAFGP